MSTNGVKPYRTHDIALVSYLFAIGIKESDDPIVFNQRITFLFDNTEKLRNLIEEYYNHRATVDPQALLETFRTVKTRTLELKRLGQIMGGDQYE